MKKRSTAIFGDLFNIANYFFLALLLMICIYPIYYIFIYSISNPTEAEKGVYLIPAGFTLKNYIRVMALPGIGSSAVLSILRTVVGTVVTVFCCSLLGYLMSKKEMYLRKILYRILVVTLYFNSGLIPYYLTIKMYHINHNFLLYVLPGAVSAYYVILLKTFIEQLPQSLEESAKLDGAGYLRIFMRIIFPLSMPIIATIAVFSAVAQWNSWFDNFLFTTSPRMKTLQLTLYEYLTQTNRIASASLQEKNSGQAVRELTPMAVRMTITMVVTLPVVFVYPFMQKYFVKGLMLGAIKG
jgi:ABC-type glycerol-3-phosphate transport system permease component